MNVGNGTSDTPWMSILEVLFLTRERVGDGDLQLCLPHPNGPLRFGWIPPIPRLNRRGSSRLFHPRPMNGPLRLDRESPPGPMPSRRGSLMGATNKIRTHLSKKEVNTMSARTLGIVAIIASLGAIVFAVFKRAQES